MEIKFPIPHPLPRMQSEKLWSCEICVVGSGPGGAVTAATLAEAGRDVLLVEEGSFLTQESCSPFSLEEMTLKYRNGGITPTFGKPKVTYVEGRCVGGGSEINSGLYHRTPPTILEKWKSDFDLRDASHEVMEPFFEKCETDLSVSTMPCPPPAASLKLHQGATALAWKSLEVPRWYKYIPDATQPSGFLAVRQSMTRTFIPRFLQAGGRLLSETKVQRLVANSMGGWVLEAYQTDHGPIKIAASHVFVCAGAIQTPTLLLRSHIGSNVGKSLQLHPTVKMTAEFKEEINSRTCGVPVHQVKEFSPRLSFGCSISSPGYLALGLLDCGSPDWAGSRHTQMANYYAMITSAARGKISLIPGFNDPLVRYNLLEEDIQTLADGFKKLGQLLFASGAIRLYPSIQNSIPISSPAELSRLVASVVPSKTNVMTIHLFSSCPMGENKSRCVADSYGKVHGARNLYINDASMLCTAPGVNPQGSIMAFALRNAFHFLSDCPVKT
jgi:choline dehydrogenase-like flavoprotein